MSLTLAVPSKGRLEELTRDFFSRAGVAINRPGGARSYAGELEGHPGVTVRFYPPSEIARELIRGSIDLGVTGTDLIHEEAEDGPAKVIFAKALGFGEAEVVVAVPDAWIDVTRMADLADVASDFRHRHGRWLRVATKYVHLTRKYFADFDIAGYRIVESTGSTESAPASGSADLVVDITTTGATLKANALRVLEDGLVLQSEAQLIVSKTSPWTNEREMELAELLKALGVPARQLTIPGSHAPSLDSASKARVPPASSAAGRGSPNLR